MKLQSIAMFSLVSAVLTGCIAAPASDADTAPEGTRTAAAWGGSTSLGGGSLGGGGCWWCTEPPPPVTFAPARFDFGKVETIDETGGDRHATVTLTAPADGDVSVSFGNAFGGQWRVDKITSMACGYSGCFASSSVAGAGPLRASKGDTVQVDFSLMPDVWAGGVLDTNMYVRMNLSQAVVPLKATTTWFVNSGPGVDAYLTQTAGITGADGSYSLGGGDKPPLRLRLTLTNLGLLPGQVTVRPIEGPGTISLNCGGWSSLSGNTYTYSVEPGQTFEFECDAQSTPNAYSGEYNVPYTIQIQSPTYTSDYTYMVSTFPTPSKPCINEGNRLPAGSACCDGFERNQTGFCAKKDDGNCGQVDTAHAVACCHNKAPCDPKYGVCKLDPGDTLHKYCFPKDPPPGGAPVCPGAPDGKPKLFGCKVTACPYSDGNLTDAYFCSKDDAVSQEKAANPECTSITCTQLGS
ncbi:MAG: hypothetical protein NVS3B10_07180 [Polyangiales bacterium]